MRLKVSFLIIELLFLINSITGNAQESFIVKFNSQANEGGGKFLENSNGEYVGLISRYNFIEEKYDCLVKKISKNGDTLLNVIISKPGTTLSFNNIIQTKIYPLEYLISGYGYSYSSPDNLFDIFIKIDSNFNILWEKQYILRPDENNSLYEYNQQLLKKRGPGVVFSTLYEFPNQKLIFFEMGDNGDSLTYRTFSGDSAGKRLYDLNYNYDSTKYLANLYRSHNIPYLGETQIITLDSVFNQTKVTYLPRWHEHITSTLLPNGNTIAGGIYDGFTLNPYQHLVQMTAIKYDTSLNLIDSCYFTDPDDEIGKVEGYYNTIDYYYPNSIFVGGTYNYDIGVYVNHPSWVTVAKIDENLNIISEKYIGGDAFYRLGDLVATSDGGLLFTSSRYNFQAQDYQHDLYVYKLDSLDFMVGITENKVIGPTKDAIVYPNPAKDIICIRTSVKNAILYLYDMQGRTLLKKSLNEYSLITKVNTTSIPYGNYTWVIQKDNTIIERGKLLIIK